MANPNPFVTLPVAADLSAYSHVAVKLGPTGINLAGVQDLCIGTMTRGNESPQVGQSAVGMAATVFLWGANGFNYVTLGANSAAIALGDELVRGANGTFLNKPTLAITSGVASTGVWTLVAHGLNVGNRIRLISFTGATAGLTAGLIYVVNTTPSADTFTLAASVDGATVTWTTNATGAVMQTVGDASGKIILAAQGAPVTSTGGQINAILL